MIDNGLCIDLLKEKIETKGRIELTVHGDSMLPTLQDGDTVYIMKNENYKIGDIIAYYLKNNENVSPIIIHRIIFVRKTYVLTKGDHNDFIDPLRISPDAVLGKVERKT